MSDKEKTSFDVRAVGDLKTEKRRVAKINPDDLLHLLYADRASFSKVSKTHRISHQVLPSEKKRRGEDGGFAPKKSLPRSHQATPPVTSSFFGGVKKTFRDAFSIALHPGVAQDVYNSFMALRQAHKAKTYRAYVCGKFFRSEGRDVLFWMDAQHAPHARYGLIIRIEGRREPFHVAVPRSQYEKDIFSPDPLLHEKIISSYAKTGLVMSSLTREELMKACFDVRLIRMNGQKIMTHFNGQVSWLASTSPSLALQKLLELRT